MQTALELIILMATLTMAAVGFARHLNLSQAEVVHRSPTGTRPGDRLYAWNRAPRHPLHCEVRFADEHQVGGQGDCSTFTDGLADQKQQRTRSRDGPAIGRASA